MILIIELHGNKSYKTSMHKKYNISKLLGLFSGYFLLALGVSPLTTQMFPTIGNIIEPFILLGTFLINKNNNYKIPFSSVFKNKKSIAILASLFIFAIIGCLTPISINYSEIIYKNIYADFRSCYLFIFSILLIFNNQWKSEEKEIFLKRLIWIIIILGFIYSYKIISKNTINTDGVIERTLGIPVHFLLIQNFLYYKSRKYWIHFILLAIGAYYAIFSFARINIVFFTMQILIVITPLLFSKSKKISQTLCKTLIIITLISSIFYIVPKAYDYYSSSEGGRAQINRIIGVGESLEKSEGERVKSIYIPFTDIENFILPEGIGWRNHIDKIQKRYDRKILSTQDSCWLYLFYHFGFFVGLYCIIILFRYLTKSFLYSIKHFSIESLEKFYLSFAFLIGFFTQGIYFTVPQNAVAGGIMLTLLSINTFKHKQNS